ncbi:MAG TPA: hypothetical protein VN577_18530 [Terriglobales bacterium]|nr:hypothetical protein [Terriglobales bacterium]
MSSRFSLPSCHQTRNSLVTICATPLSPNAQQALLEYGKSRGNCGELSLLLAFLPARVREACSPARTKRPGLAGAGRAQEQEDCDGAGLGSFNPAMYDWMTLVTIFAASNSPLTLWFNEASNSAASVF